MNVVLRVVAGPHEGSEYVFDRHETFVVGRSSQAQFAVPDDGFLSRNHFLIEFNPPACYLRDLGSTNGTKVNGVRVDSVRLRDADVVEAGQSRFVVQVEETWANLPRVKCLGCDRPAPIDTALAARPGDTVIQWICDACAEQRRRFPVPAPGYWIERRIGGGGMGEVYQARRLADNRTVALKMMIPTAAASERAREYFRREHMILRDLRHPNIVAFDDLVEIDGQFQIIMEFVDGKGAKEWADAQQVQPLEIAPAIRVGIQLLMALDHAHTKGYVHRDIKPSNILVMGPPVHPVVKLSDFGLAKSFRDNAGFSGLTHQGDVGGSVGFLSPDHIRDFREVKAPADIYSAGATLYYLLSGHYPYYAFNPKNPDAYSMILENPAMKLRIYRPDAPESLDRILFKALEKSPRDRWRSAAEMASALQAVLQSTIEPPSP